MIVSVYLWDLRLHAKMFPLVSLARYSLLLKPLATSLASKIREFKYVGISSKNRFLISEYSCFLFSPLLAGLRDSDCRALVGERVRLPADQPEAIRPAGGADRLGRTPGFLAVRPLPDRQRETKLQVRLAWTDGEGANVFFRPRCTQTAFHTP